MMTKVHIRVKPGQKFPEYVQFSSTWQENIYVAEVDLESKERLITDPQVEVVVVRPLDLNL